MLNLQTPPLFINWANIILRDPPSPPRHLEQELSLSPRRGETRRPWRRGSPRSSTGRTSGGRSSAPRPSPAARSLLLARSRWGKKSQELEPEQGPLQVRIGPCWHEVIVLVIFVGLLDDWTHKTRAFARADRSGRTVPSSPGRRESRRPFSKAGPG